MITKTVKLRSITLRYDIELIEVVWDTVVEEDGAKLSVRSHHEAYDPTQRAAFEAAVPESESVKFVPLMAWA